MSDALSIDHRRTRVAEGDGQVIVYVLLSANYNTLQGIFATELGAEQARGKLNFPTDIEEWEVGP